MSNAIENARRIILENPAKIKQLETEMAEAKQLMALAAKFESPNRNGAAVHKQLKQFITFTSARRPKKRDEILALAATLLLEKGAMHTEEILKAFETQGVDVGGAKPLANLSAYLSRAKDQFEHRRALGGWHLKKQSSNGALTPLELHSESDLA